MSYRDLRGAALRQAERVVSATVAGLPPRARFIQREARKLVESGWSPMNATDDSPGTALAQLVADNWLAIQEGAGGELLNGTGLWKPLMCEWPMGAYADLAARALHELPGAPLAELDVFEVGSGVGNLARQIAGQARSWVRSDLDPSIPARQQLPGTVERYDMDEPGVPARADVVVAVNAVHCAADYPAAIRHLSEMVRPGGFLVLSEGAPVTAARAPWALTWAFGLLDGWWDRGGFLDRTTWAVLMADAGLVQLAQLPYREDGHLLGGVLIGRRP